MTHKHSEGPLYRSRNGAVLGVCRGVAEHLDFSVAWMRVIAVALTLLGGIWPGVVVYFAAAVLLKPEPVTPLVDDREREFYESYASSRKMAVHRLKRMFDSLERRIQRMEDMVTAREYDWDRRLNQ